ELLISQPSITYKDRSATSNFISDLTFMHPSSGISFNISKTLNNHHTYRVTNSLCKKAMVVGLDAGFVAIEALNKFLEKFIQQYSVDSSQYLVVNTNSNEIQSSESSDLDDNQENGIPFDVSTIQDPAVKKRKGVPRVKHIKNSFETKNIRSSNKKKKAMCLCSYYKQSNHYAKTCAIDP
ncbi:2170_t:CDS:1, partial [Gigaspora margarita]